MDRRSQRRFTADSFVSGKKLFLDDSRNFYFRIFLFSALVGSFLPNSVTTCDFLWSLKRADLTFSLPWACAHAQSRYGAILT